MVQRTRGDLRLLLLERLRPSDAQRLLLLAAVIGVAGALAGTSTLVLGLLGVVAGLAAPLYLQVLETFATHPGEAAGAGRGRTAAGPHDQDRPGVDVP
jgi:hypothetical protein